MPVQDTDTFLLNNAGASYRITAEKLKTSLSSSGGSSWTLQNSGATALAEFSGIDFGDNRWVTCCRSGSNFAMWSDDGVSWTDASLPYEKPFYDIKAANGRYVIVGSACVLSSADGKTYSDVGSVGSSYRGVACDGNGTWIAVASGTALFARSYDDGASFMEVSGSLLSSGWNDITFGNGKFVAVGVSGNYRFAWTADKGLTWNNIVDTSRDWTSVTFGNGRFVAVSRNNAECVKWSEDGVNWNPVTPPENRGWNAVTYGNGEFVAVGSDGTAGIMRSPDGITWTMETPPNNNMWINVAYGQDKFISVAETGSGEKMMVNEVVAPVEGIMLVNRSGVSYKCDITNLKDKLLDDDLLLVNRSGASYKVTGATFKEDLLGGGGIMTISTWNGTASEQSIVDGVDYRSGGLVIIKQTSAGSPEGWRWWSKPIDEQKYFDSVNSNGFTFVSGEGVKTFNNDGYTIGRLGGVNSGSQQYIGYGLVPTPGFFDIQIYTQTGDHPHNLGVEPTFIITKGDVAANWHVYHKELGQDRAFLFNNSMGNYSQPGIWGTTGSMNASTFKADKNSHAGSNGTNHIAYLFADSPGKCKAGKYVGSTGEVNVNLGFKPGWLMIKNGDQTSNFRVFDFLRPGESLKINTKQSQESAPFITFTDSGFTVAAAAGVDINQNGYNYYYLAIAAAEGQAT